MASVHGHRGHQDHSGRSAHGRARPHRRLLGDEHRAADVHPHPVCDRSGSAAPEPHGPRRGQALAFEPCAPGHSGPALRAQEPCRCHQCPDEPARRVALGPAALCLGRRPRAQNAACGNQTAGADARALTGPGNPRQVSGPPAGRRGPRHSPCRAAADDRARDAPERADADPGRGDQLCRYPH